MCDQDCEETEEVITFDEIKGLLDKSYELIYIDYRDNLDDRLDEVQEAIQKQDWQPLDEVLDGWTDDATSESIHYILTDQLPDEMERAFDIDHERAVELIEENEDDLRDIIYSRDESNPIKDLIRNTSEPVVFYDLGVYIDECWMDEDMQKEAHREIKKALGIKMRNKTWDELIWSLIANASYGGRLVVYFRGDIDDLMHIEENGFNMVEFTDPEIALIDTYNGSGHNESFDHLQFMVPLDVTNLFLDRTFKYSYVYSVCGMSSSFCDGTTVKFSKKPRRKKSIPKSTLQAELDIEAKYKATFAAGKCTYGDMDYNRHRHKVYINDFPCGTHCKDCGTFWVD